MKYYRVSDRYINFLRKNNNLMHVYENSKPNGNKRDYIGIVMNIKNYEYFIPLHHVQIKCDPHKPTCHNLTSDSGKKYGSCSILCMIPVPKSEITPIDFNKESENKKYIQMAQYRIIKRDSHIIKKKAKNLYNLKIKLLENPQNESLKKINFLQHVINFKETEKMYDQFIENEKFKTKGKSLADLPEEKKKSNHESLKILNHLKNNNYKKDELEK